MASETEPESKPAPSFQGRLKIQEFAFHDAVESDGTTADGGRRRSRRLASTDTADRRSVSSSKRKVSGESPDPSSNPGTPDPASASSESASVYKKRRGGGSGGSGGVSTPRLGRKGAGYAPPSAYAHLSHLPDAVGPNLLVFFVGLNPGVETARQQHAYAHPSNLFWRLLASSGVTPRLCSPTEDGSMPRLYSLGLTNIVSRPSRNGAELGKSEMDAGVAVLEEKMRRWRPEAVCIVGKGIWESIWRVRYGRPIRKDEFSYGWQHERENMGVIGKEGQGEDEKEEGVEYRDDWKGARVFVGTSTSGLAASLRPAEKEEIWRQLGEWVERRREERAAASTLAADTTSSSTS